jgi:hypothetical protein
MLADRSDDQTVDVRRHRGERRTVQCVVALPPLLADGHRAGFEQEAQVLADRRPADRTAGGEVDDPGRLVGQLGQQRAAHRVGQRSEDVHGDR